MGTCLAPPAILMARKVLVVDDNQTTRQVISRFLKGHGYTVTTTADASEALERFSQEPFDLVLSDFAMPGMDGANLTQRIHSLAPQIPVVIMSGHSGAKKENLLQAGAADFIEKPLLLHELLATLRNNMPEELTGDVLDSSLASCCLPRRGAIKMSMTREIETKMDDLARRYAETHDEEVKAELEALSRQLAGLPTH